MSATRRAGFLTVLMRDRAGWRRMVAEVVGMRVLLVEDEIKMSRALRRGLEQEGYAVDTAL